MNANANVELLTLLIMKFKPCEDTMFILKQKETFFAFSKRKKKKKNHKIGSFIYWPKLMSGKFQTANLVSKDITICRNKVDLHQNLSLEHEVRRASLESSDWSSIALFSMQLL